jgi:hypothetical protein
MEIKKEWKYFTIFNHEKEEEYLREQHKAGWKFVKVTGIGFYHFEKCQPEDVIYQLDYNKEGLENKQEYIQMFADCGWEYIQNYVDYSYFRKPANAMSGDEQIFCDESSRIAMMERVYKGRLIPLLIIFCACLLPQFILNLTNRRYFLSVLMGGILAIYVVFFGYSAVHYYRKKNKVE